MPESKGQPEVNSGSLSTEETVALYELLSALASSEARITLIHLLSQNPQGVSVYNIAALMGLEPASVSSHLKQLLVTQQHVTFRRDGTFKYYSLLKNLCSALHQAIDQIFGLPPQSKYDLFLQQVKNFQKMLEDKELLAQILAEETNVTTLLDLYAKIDKILNS